MDLKTKELIKECAEDIWTFMPNKAKLVTIPIKDEYINAVVETIKNLCEGRTVLSDGSKLTLHDVVDVVCPKCGSSDHHVDHYLGNTCVCGHNF